METTQRGEIKETKHLPKQKLAKATGKIATSSFLSKNRFSGKTCSEECHLLKCQHTLPKTSFFLETSQLHNDPANFARSRNHRLRRSGCRPHKSRHCTKARAAESIWHWKQMET